MILWLFLIIGAPMVGQLAQHDCILRKLTQFNAIVL